MAKCEMPNGIGKIFALPREPIPVFTRNDKRLDHLRLLEVAAKLIQFIEPELVTTVIRVAPEIPEIFHHHKHLVRLRTRESFILHDLAQHRSARHDAAVQPVYQRISIAIKTTSAEVYQCIHKGIVSESVIKRSERRTLDPGIDKRPLVCLQLLCPVFPAYNDIACYYSCVGHELRVKWPSSVAGSIESINQPARLLKLYRQEIGGRDIYPPALDARRITAALEYLIAPEVEPAFVGFAAQEINIVLPYEVFRSVERISSYDCIRCGGEQCVCFVARKRERAQVWIEMVVNSLRRNRIKVIRCDVLEAVVS